MANCTSEIYWFRCSGQFGKNGRFMCSCQLGEYNEVGGFDQFVKMAGFVVFRNVMNLVC